MIVRERKLSLEENKAIVRRFLESYSVGCVDETLSQMTESCIFAVMRRSESLPIPRAPSKAEFGEILRNLRTMFPNGVRVTVRSMIAEGNKVAVEAESYAEMGNGKIYNNLYHFLVTVRDGKIDYVKEYTDFLHAFEVLS